MDFVRRFVARHAEPLAPGDGCDEAELRAAEARLGLPLPEALRTAYGLLGRRPDLTRVQDRLLRPDQLEVDDGVLVYRVENQHVTRWGIPLEAVTAPDPPVVYRVGEAWVPFVPRVSDAVVEMVLSEWLFAGDEFVDNRDLDETAVAVLEQRFERLPVPDHPFWAAPGGGPVRFFEGSGVVLREDAGVWLWVRAESAAALAAVRRILPGEWLMDAG
jgi:hypothetical protein